jgi:hypothetical protein
MSTKIGELTVDTNEADLIEEMLFVAQGEDCYLCREGNEDCIWH